MSNVTSETKAYRLPRPNKKQNTKPTRPKTGTAAANKALDNAIPNPNGRRKHSGIDVIHAKSGLRDPLEK